MPRPPTGSVQLTLYVPAYWLVALDELAVRLSRPGATMTRSVASRVALARGLDFMTVEESDRYKEPREMAKLAAADPHPWTDAMREAMERNAAKEAKK